MGERLQREKDVLAVLKVGKTKARNDYFPRLTRVQLGPRCVAYTDSSVQRLIQELIAETEAAPKLTPAPNKRKKR